MIRFDLTAPMQNVASAFDTLRPYVFAIAFLITLIGYYAQVWRHRGEPAKTLEALGLIAICVMFAASVPVWRPYVVSLFYYPAEKLARDNESFRLEQAVNGFYRGIKDLLVDTAANGDAGGTAAGVFRFIWNFGEITRTALVALSIQLLVTILTLIGAIIVLPFYFLQHVLVAVFFTFMPVAVCALTVPALRDRAATYMAMTASVLSWPFGFSIVAVATNLVFDVPFSSDLGAATPAGLMLAPLLRELVAAVIMVVGTILVPPTMFFLAAYGGTHIDPIMSAARSVPMLGGLAKR